MKPIGLDRARILVVDDDPTIGFLIQTALQVAGYRFVSVVTDAREATDRFRTVMPDLVVLDFHMPHMDGFSLLHRLTAEMPVDLPVPVLMLTADISPEVKREALLAGAKDFVEKPFDNTELLLRIRNLLETRLLQLELIVENETLEERVSSRTIELEHARREALEHLAVAAEFRDDMTGEHAKRVGRFAALIAQSMGQTEEVIALLARAAPLHDIGKIGIRDDILLKPGPLTAEEFELMKKHTQIGGQILADSKVRVLQMAREIALTHHERWDGKGYEGLKGLEIPVSGRITALADTFDAMTHDRPYRKGSPPEVALEEIHQQRGRQFDPEVVDVVEGTDVILRLSEEGPVDDLREVAI